MHGSLKSTYENKLKKLAGKYLNKDIQFLGKVEHNNLPELYSKADVFATASTIETEGIVILEAMACGLPIIGVDVLAIPTIVKHKKNGFITKEGDSDKIAKYMEILLKNKELRMKFGQQSLEIAKKFDVKKCVDCMEKVYEMLVKKRFTKRWV